MRCTTLASHALVVALLLAGCRTESYASPLDPRIPIVGNSLACLATSGGVDTYVLDVFAIDTHGVSSSPRATLCAFCGTDPRVECTHLARACRCSGPRIEPRDIADALSGVRLDALPGDQSLCARLVLRSRGATSGSSSGPAEECAPEVCDLAAPDDAVLCGLTDAFSLSVAETPVALTQFVCRDLPAGDSDAGVDRCPALALSCRQGHADACTTYEALCVADGGVSLTPLDLESCTSF